MRRAPANWVIQRTDADLALMGKTLGISEDLALILANRGIRSKNAAIKFLRPEMRFVGDIRQMKDMTAACAAISQSAASGEKIFIYGDYDVDGVMGTVILLKTLRAFGADAQFYIPHREVEGYGLNVEAVRRIHDAGGQFIIACDNGISAIAEVEEANRLGVKVAIIDHHEPGFAIGGGGGKQDVIPDALCVVDPKQQACAYPFTQYCAAGLSFRFAEAFYEFHGREFSARNEFLSLAAFATVCDMVPLMGENRILAKAGLEAMKKDKKANLGLWHLMKAKAIHEKAIDVFDIGFLLGPCVNASGRLASASGAVELFLTGDGERAEALAKELVDLNELRKEMTAQAVENAMEALTAGGGLDKVLVLYNEGVHESIAGIVAGRIKEAVNRPVIVLTRSGEFAKGSARSIEAYNIFEALYANRDLFVRFGGHAMAAGLTLRMENIEPLRRRLNEGCSLQDGDFRPAIYIERQLQPEFATYGFTKELNLLAPFGKGNPEPLFCAKGLKPEQLRMIDGKNTMIFTFGVEGSRRKIRAVCFGMNDVLKDQVNDIFDEYDSGKIFAGVLRSSNFLMDVVYALEINEYNNNASVQMRIKDFQIYT